MPWRGETRKAVIVRRSIKTYPYAPNGNKKARCWGQSERYSNPFTAPEIILISLQAVCSPKLVHF